MKIIKKDSIETWFSPIYKKMYTLEDYVEGPDGRQCVKEGNSWYKNNLIHRRHGPAQIFLDNSKIWYHNDILYRKNGKCIEDNKDPCFISVTGKWITEEVYWNE